MKRGFILYVLEVKCQHLVLSQVKWTSSSAPTVLMIDVSKEYSHCVILSGMIPSWASHQTSFKTDRFSLGCRYVLIQVPACVLAGLHMCACVCVFVFGIPTLVNGFPFIYFSVLPEGTWYHTNILWSLLLVQQSEIHALCMLIAQKGKPWGDLDPADWKNEQQGQLTDWHPKLARECVFVCLWQFRECVKIRKCASVAWSCAVPGNMLSYFSGPLGVFSLTHPLSLSHTHTTDLCSYYILVTATFIHFPFLWPNDAQKMVPIRAKYNLDTRRTF